MDDFNFLHNTFNQQDKNRQALVQASDLDVVVVEDDHLFGTTVAKYLSKKHGLKVHYFESGQACLEKIKDLKFEYPFCLVTDIGLDQGLDGLTLVDLLKEQKLHFASIAMTGFGSIESAITATKKGVYTYLTKPFDLEDLARLIKEALSEVISFPLQFMDGPIDQEKVKKENNLIGKFKIERPREEDIFCKMVGRSPLMKEVFNRIEKVSKSDSTVFITGPSGTGKELVAQAIHHLSVRDCGPLVCVNCGAIPRDLLESELFGHIKGAFTGAVSNRKGRFEMADRGTIFLDEIGDMPAMLQVKLLRVLQNKMVEPVGGDSSHKVDVRVIAATHKNIEEAVENDKFREDLYYRLAVIPIRIPALKERKEDIPLLIGHFLSNYVSADGRNEIEFSDEALNLIMSYDWPGNVRELENLIERLVILRGGNCIQAEDLPAKLYRNNLLASPYRKHYFDLPDEGVDLKKVLSEIEDSLILQAIDRTNGNKNQASKLLYMNRTTLIEKMKKKVLDTKSDALP